VAFADGRGHFVFETLGAGRHFLSARAAGYLKMSKPWPSFESGAWGDVSIELRRDPEGESCRVSGRLAALDGGVPKGVKLSSKWGLLRLQGDRFEVQGLRAGPLHLEFKAPGYLIPQLPPLRLAGGSSTDIGTVQFAPAGEIVLYIRDAGGKSVSQAQVRLTRAGASVGRGSGVHGPFKGATRRHRWGGKGKRKSVPVLRSTRVPYGTWKLVVQRRGHRPWTRVLTLDGTRRKLEFEVQLRAKAPDRGRLGGPGKR